MGRTAGQHPLDQRTGRPGRGAAGGRGQRGFGRLFRNGPHAAWRRAAAFLPSDDESAPPVIIVNRSAADLSGRTKTRWAERENLRRIRRAASDRSGGGRAISPALGNTAFPISSYRWPRRCGRSSRFWCEHPGRRSRLLRRCGKSWRGLRAARTHARRTHRRGAGGGGRASDPGRGAGVRPSGAVPAPCWRWAGLFAITAWRVAEQRRDIAIRVALGAANRRVLSASGRARVRDRRLRGRVRASLFDVDRAADSGIDHRRDRTRGGGLCRLHRRCCIALLIVACVLPARQVLRIDPASLLRVQ